MKAMTYRVRADAVEGNKERVRAVLDALRESRHAGIYLSAEVDGEGTFVHVLDPETGSVLGDLPEFRAFQEGLRDILVGGPVAHDVEVVGSVGV